MGTCNTGINDACNTYTCESPLGSAQCTATPVTNGGTCNDGVDGNDPDTCNDGDCVGVGKKIFIVFRIKHLNW